MTELPSTAPTVVYSGKSSATNKLPDGKFENYRREVGEKLNRQRIGVEYENAFPIIPPAPEKVAGDDSLEKSFATQYEQIRVHENDERMVPRHYADAAVQYDLADEQKENNWVSAAQAQFIRDYIANARAHGLVVAIDSNYNVHVLRQYAAVLLSDRGPQSISDQGEKFQTFSAMLTAHFIRAPYCAL